MMNLPGRKGSFPATWDSSFANFLRGPQATRNRSCRNLETGVGIEPTNNRFAGDGLTTWLSRPLDPMDRSADCLVLQTFDGQPLTPFPPVFTLSPGPVSVRFWWPRERTCHPCRRVLPLDHRQRRTAQAAAMLPQPPHPQAISRWQTKIT